jgi:hypothetical protein
MTGKIIGDLEPRDTFCIKHVKLGNELIWFIQGAYV